jgi:hypothetical protein
MQFCQFCRTTDNPSSAGICQTRERALTCPWLQGDEKRSLQDNGLRNETGALIGGLKVEDYVAGMEDFRTGAPIPDFTTSSYDLGRQRAAEERARDQRLKDWLRQQDEHSDRVMREILPPDAYAEYREKIDAIRAVRR